MNYPVWQVPLLGGPSLIALVAIVHVFIAQIAVGGGFFLAFADRRAQRTRSPELLAYVRAHTHLFLLLSMVAGAVTGVGIWFTIQLVHPAATSLLIHEFVFGWATEWVFFLVEIAALLVYHYAFERLTPRDRLAVALVYARGRLGQPVRHRRHPLLHAHPRGLARDGLFLGRLLQPHLLALPGLPHLPTIPTPWSPWRRTTPLAPCWPAPRWSCRSPARSAVVPAMAVPGATPRRGRGSRTRPPAASWPCTTRTRAQSCWPRPRPISPRPAPPATPIPPWAPPAGRAYCPCPLPSMGTMPLGCTSRAARPVRPATRPAPRDRPAASGACTPRAGWIVRCATAPWPTTPRPWVQEPDCSTCHVGYQAPTVYDAFGVWVGSEELPLFRHRTASGLRCGACHGSPHALYPASNPVERHRDVLQPLRATVLPLPIGSEGRCTACHETVWPMSIHHENMVRPFRGPERREWIAKEED